MNWLKLTPTSNWENVFTPEKIMKKFNIGRSEHLKAYILIWRIVNFHRYSDRVKTETERLNHLELDDLEVFYSLFCFLFLYTTLKQIHFKNDLRSIFLTFCRWMKRRSTTGSSNLGFTLFRLGFYCDDLSVFAIKIGFLYRFS